MPPSSDSIAARALGDRHGVDHGPEITAGEPLEWAGAVGGGACAVAVTVAARVSGLKKARCSAERSTTPSRSCSGP